MTSGYSSVFVHRLAQGHSSASTPIRSVAFYHLVFHGSLRHRGLGRRIGFPWRFMGPVVKRFAADEIKIIKLSCKFSLKPLLTQEWYCTMRSHCRGEMSKMSTHSFKVKYDIDHCLQLYSPVCSSDDNVENSVSILNVTQSRSHFRA